jgi:hypothetical protein
MTISTSNVTVTKGIMARTAIGSSGRIGQAPSPTDGRQKGRIMRRLMQRLKKAERDRDMAVGAIEEAGNYIHRRLPNLEVPEHSDIITAVVDKAARAEELEAENEIMRHALMRLREQYEPDGPPS